jgi:hypothetical protein
MDGGDEWWLEAPLSVKSRLEKELRMVNTRKDLQARLIVLAFALIACPLASPAGEAKPWEVVAKVPPKVLVSNVCKYVDAAYSASVDILVALPLRQTISAIDMETMNIDEGPVLFSLYCSMKPGGVVDPSSTRCFGAKLELRSLIQGMPIDKLSPMDRNWDSTEFHLVEHDKGVFKLSSEVAVSPPGCTNTTRQMIIVDFARKRVTYRSYADGCGKTWDETGEAACETKWSKQGEDGQWSTSP